MKTLTDVRVYFRISDIAGNDKYVKLYTGFDSYDVLLAFFGSLTLMYWKDPQRKLQGSTRTKTGSYIFNINQTKVEPSQLVA